MSKEERELSTQEFIKALLKQPERVRIELHKMADDAWTGILEMQSAPGTAHLKERERHYESIVQALLASFH